MARLRLKKLQSYLEDIDVFEKPKILLEQYATSPHIAACMLHTIQSRYGDIEGHIVADLGVGCGVLSTGASLLGCGLCIGYDIDAGALDQCKANLEEHEISNVELIQADVTRLPAEHLCPVHTVIMNPPFGTKHNKGIDVEFVQQGLGMCTGAVYSLHKSATRKHLLRKAAEWGVEGEVIAELRFDLPQTYRFHKHASVDIEVDLIRFSKQKT